MKTKIVADSSCDIFEVDGVDFASVAMTINTEERSFVDDGELNIRDMLDYLAGYNDRSRTSCPDIDSWLNAFGDSDEIYVVALTSGLSGTYNSALTAKQMYEESHPGAKVYVFDTLTTSAELVTIIDKIAELVKIGKPFEEICETVDKYMKRTHLFFCLKSLHNFAQNGRVSKLLADAVGVFGINIIGKASEKGTLEPISKCRGQARVITNLIKEMKMHGFAGGRVNITHVNNLELAESFGEAVRNAFPNVITNIYPSRGLVAYYAEEGSMLIGFETV